MLGGGGSPAPATFSQGGNPATYVPTAQPQADLQYQQLLQGFPTSPGATPAGFYYPQAQAYANAYNLGADQLSADAINSALNNAYVAQRLGLQGAPALQGAGMSLLNTGFDPQQALFNRTQGQVLDQSNVARAMSGTANTPYGASVNTNALSNFDLAWQNQQLARQAQAAGAAAPLLQAAPTLAATAGALPYNLENQIGNNIQTTLGQLTQLGNNQFALPQQLANDLQSYLQLGQAASQGALQGGNLGFNQTAQGIGGLISGLGGINNLTGGGLTSGLGSLFGGGGGAASQAALFSGLTPDVSAALASGTVAVPTAADIASAGAFGGGGDFLAAAAPAAFS